MTRITDDGQVEFAFYRPGAAEVRAIGDFKSKLGFIELKSAGDGWWKALADLDMGDYRFRYSVDGQWFTDYASHGVEAGKQGYVSVLWVPSSVSGRPVKQVA